MLRQNVIKSIELKLIKIRSLAERANNDYLLYILDMAVSEAGDISGVTISDDRYRESEPDRDPRAGHLPRPPALRLIVR